MVLLLVRKRRSCGPGLRRPQQSLRNLAYGGKGRRLPRPQCLMHEADPPPLKWSASRYGFEPEEDRDGEQEAPAGGGRGQAAAGGRPGLAGAVGGGGDP